MSAPASPSPPVGLISVEDVPTPILTQFRITNEQILGFRRYIKSPRDCVINALQIIGILDERSSNLIRIIMASQNIEIFTTQIEAIFTLYSGKKFRFKPTSSYAKFSTYIRNNLAPGHACFAGYESSQRHAFLIGRNLDGTILYIDPQLETICPLESPQCSQLIANNTKWYLLFNSEQQLTPIQLRDMGFSL
jgi:hypothetical protein